MKPRVYTFSFGGSFWVGMVLLALGVLWTLDNLGLIDSGPILQYWPVVLIALGLVRMTGIAGQAKPVFGAILTAAGALLLLNQLGIVNFGVAELWALGLIFMGGMIVYRSTVGRRLRSTTGDTSDRLNLAAVMSGIERKVQSTAFQGGEVSAVMGGVELNFGPAKLANDEATLEVLAIMGGIEIYVPADWHVAIEVTPVMGGVDDHRSAPPVAGTSRLRLTGFVMMGGVEVKDLPERR